MRRISSSDDNEGLRIVELVVQAIAMFLCALILLNMHLESQARAPTFVCLDANQPPLPMQ